MVGGVKVCTAGGWIIGWRGLVAVVEVLGGPMGGTSAGCGELGCGTCDASANLTFRCRYFRSEYRARVSVPPPSAN